MSSLDKKMIEDWLEDYEDMLLARRAEKAGKKTGTSIRKFYLDSVQGIESNIHETRAKNIQERIIRTIEERLCISPEEVGKPLLKQWKEHRRLKSW